MCVVVRTINMDNRRDQKIIVGVPEQVWTEAHVPLGVLEKTFPDADVCTAKYFLIVAFGHQTIVANCPSTYNCPGATALRIEPTTKRRLG